MTEPAEPAAEPAAAPDVDRATPCGAWRSPILPESLVAGAVGISELALDADAVWWAESRPDEGGRTALMRAALGVADEPPGAPVEVTPPEANVRTRAHEYGGGAWWAHGGAAWYVDDADQRVRALPPGGGAPVPLTSEPPSPGAHRWADFRPTPDGRWLVAVSERAGEPGTEPENALHAIATDGSGRVATLASGADFYGSPRVSPDGERLAWIEWDHPNMPWDDTTLRVAALETGPDGAPRLGEARTVAGGHGAGEAVVQPEWAPDGTLHYLSDRADLWWLYADGRDEPVLTVDGEIGYPPWVFGLSRYAFRDDGSVVAARFDGGLEHLDGHPEYSAFHAVRAAGGRVAFVGASFAAGPAVVVDGRVVRAPKALGLDGAFLAAPEPLSFPTGPADAADGASDGGGDGGGATAHALYYAPANPGHAVPAGERPPLIVVAHGGPTSQARTQLNLGIRFWTSRGFGVVDVNYRGSSGFGRAYRKALDGAWGVVDVEDCTAAARALVARGDADPGRLIIRGGSAGGYTVLCALAFHDTFTAGASLYGVADLEALAGDTHKFESRYLDSLVGPWPEAAGRYRERSPIHHLDGFTAPMIVLQGSEDRIVPPNQSRMIVEALDARGVPVAYLEFEGEQHGFRRSETIVAALRAELAFYAATFGFRPADELPALEIRNRRAPADAPSPG